MQDSLRSRVKILSNLETLDHQKILATVIHILGLNAYVWETPPETIEDIWKNYPTEDPVEQMKNTIDSLLDNNKGWGKGDNYVDDQRRVSDLKRDLRGTKIVTIYGEGGLGKTELVYQTLRESITDENQSLRYDYLLPFTFKGEQQGEFSITDPGFRTVANQSGWTPVPELFVMVTELARYLDPELDLGDETDRDTWFNKAAEFLVKKNVWLIIDNHEVDDNDDDLDTLLTKFLNHDDVQQNNSRIIITTRVNPPEQRPGLKIPMKALSVNEMSSLARKKAMWLFNRNDDNDIKFPLHIQTDTHWTGVSKFIKGELRTKRHELAAGHPYVVFIAVYEHMFENTEENEFQEVLAKIIQKTVEGTNGDDTDRLSSLMTYIIGQSFNYMKTCAKKEDAKMHLRLTQLQRIRPDDLIEIYGAEWRTYLTELVNLEILVEVEEDEEFGFRTEQHRQQLRDYVCEKFKIDPPSNKWKWWYERMSAIKLGKRLKIPSLRVLGIADDASENHNDELRRAWDLLKEYEDWSVDDVHACINIVKHFGIILSEVDEGNQFLLAPANSRSDYRLALVKFLYSTVSSGLESLAEYLAQQYGDRKEPNLALFKQILHFLNRINSEGEKYFKQQTEFFPALRAFEKDEKRAIGLGQISSQLDHVLLQLLRNIPTPSRASLDSIRRLWNLGQDKVDEEKIAPTELLKVGLSQVQLSGPQESLNIIHYLADHCTENHFRGRTIEANDLGLIQTGDFLRQHKHLITQDPKIRKCIEILKSYVWYDPEIYSTSNTVPHPLFHSEEITLNVEFEGNRAIIGKDANFTTNEITHNITLLNELEKSLTQQKVKVKATRYSIDGSIHCSILDSFIETHFAEEEPEVLIDPYAHLRPIEDVSIPEMRDILNSIDFDLSIHGSALFGVRLKEVLKERGIQHQKKVWRRWKAAHYPAEGAPNKYQLIEDIIPELMEGNWKVETGEGLDIRIRKVSSEGARIKPRSIPAIRTHTIPVKKTRRTMDVEIYSEAWNPRAKTTIGRRNRARTTGWRSNERPACALCKSRVHLSMISAGELYCSNCDHIIDAGSGKCVDPYCKSC